MSDASQSVGNTVLGKVAAASLFVACAALVGVAGVEGWQVFARYVLNDSPSWTEPVALLLMSTAMMFGAAVGVRDQKHFGFFMLAEHTRPAVRTALQYVALAISIAVGLIFLVAGLHLVSESWDFPMAGVSLPQGVVYLPIALGGALIATFGLERGMISLRTRAPSA